MLSSATAARLREAAERIYDPATIQAKLAGLSGSQKDVFWNLYRKSRAGLTAAEIGQRKELISAFNDAADDVEAGIYKTFRQLGTETWNLSSVKRVGADTQLLQQINNRLRALGVEVNSTLQDGLLDQFKTAWVDGAYRLDVTTPPSTEIRFGLLPDREILALLSEPWKGANFSQRLGIITDKMAGEIRHQLLTSMASEESWSDAARRIRGEMGTGGQRSVWRAEMIARTELGHAQTLANQQLYAENSDAIEDVIFVAHPGACIICRDKHGKPVSEVGYPIEDTHPNCACDILAVPKSWGELKTPDDGDFSIKPQSLTSWASDKGLADVLE